MHGKEKTTLFLHEALERFVQKRDSWLMCCIHLQINCYNKTY